jgi:hypothetical protein
MKNFLLPFKNIFDWKFLKSFGGWKFLIEIWVEFSQKRQISREKSVKNLVRKFFPSLD